MAGLCPQATHSWSFDLFFIGSCVDLAGVFLAGKGKEVDDKYSRIDDVHVEANDIRIQEVEAEKG